MGEVGCSFSANLTSNWHFTPPCVCVSVCVCARLVCVGGAFQIGAYHIVLRHSDTVPSTAPRRVEDGVVLNF